MLLSAVNLNATVITVVSVLMSYVKLTHWKVYAAKNIPEVVLHSLLVLVLFLDEKPVINSCLGYILSSHVFQFVPKQGTTMSFFLITFFLLYWASVFSFFFFFLKLKIPLVLMTRPHDSVAMCVYYAANTEHAPYLPQQTFTTPLTLFSFWVSTNSRLQWCSSSMRCFWSYSSHLITKV